MREGWREVAVEEVATVVGGGTPKSSVPEYWGGDVPWLTPKDLAQNPARFTAGGARSITELGLKNSSAKLLPAGAVLLTSRAPVGYVSVAAEPIATNQGFKSLVLDDTQLPEFWYYLLAHSTDYLQANSGGSTFQEISGAAVKKLRFAIPPLDEQRRIVVLIGSLDDAIEAAQQLHLKLLEGHRRLRSDLFHRKDAEWVRLGDLATVQLGRMLSKQRASGSDQAPYLRNANVQWSGLDLSDLKSMSFPEKDRQKYELRAGDLIVCEGGDPGRSVLLKRDLPGVFYQKAIHRVRAGSSISPEYLYHWITQAYADGSIEDLCTVTTIRHLTAEKFRTLRVPVMPVSDQDEIVGVLETSRAAQLLIRESVNRLRTLRSNLLTVLLSGEHEIPESYDELMEEDAA